MGSVFILIPWGVVGLTIGYFSKTQKDAIVNGFLFGFFASFIFMVHGYSGSASLISRIPAFGALGIFGGVCGLVLGLIGFISKRFLKE